MNRDILPGRNFPIGATVYPDGTNFSIFSKGCVELELLLFDDADDPKPSRVIKFDPVKNKTYYYWHIFIPKLKSGQLYAYRAYGPYLPEQGYRFNGKKVLVDPCAKTIIAGKKYSREAAMTPHDNCAQALKSVAIDVKDYDWGGDYPPRFDNTRSIIYELHVGGFTKNPNSGVSPKKRGTYAGLIEKIPYLKSLGITSIELMPIQQFDKQDARDNLVNYWGYSPIGFFAPHFGYSSRKDHLGPVDEFRDMVKALHRAGIEVILDVVFNHTSEGDSEGPTFSFKGLENPAYYILENDKRHYKNYSGCGNTLNSNHSIVRRMIENCLCYWVKDMHVDGFRFDLASVMSRGEKGELLENPPILWAIESNPILAGVKIIAEAWDASGLYQVGSFIGDRFSEWNGLFRDDVRRFVKGDKGIVGDLAKRICGSPDIYRRMGRKSWRSVNFVTCHDGFTLNDLVSYSEKHNDANEENNSDGSNNNYGWNCGIEGPTDKTEIEKLRIRQIKKFLTILFISQGTPMLLMGDEVRRTQRGNNNAYCQDNEISWFNWDNIKKDSYLFEFVKKLINFTKTQKIFRECDFWTSEENCQRKCIEWHGIKLNVPDFGNDSHSIAFTLRDKAMHDCLHVMLNAYWESLEFEIPVLHGGRKWHRIIDTSLLYPKDFCAPEKAVPAERHKYAVDAHSSVVLMAL